MRGITARELRQIAELAAMMPDATGLRGGTRFKSSPASGEDFPYDRQTGVLGRDGAPGLSLSSHGSSAPPPTPMDTAHTAWDDLDSIVPDMDEAAGMPVDIGISSRAGRMDGYGVVPVMLASMGDEDTDYDDLQQAAEEPSYRKERAPADMNDFRGDASDNIWEILQGLLAAMSDPSEIRGGSGHVLDLRDIGNDDGEVEASRTWRGLVTPGNSEQGHEEDRACV